MVCHDTCVRVYSAFSEQREEAKWIRAEVEQIFVIMANSPQLGTEQCKIDCVIKGINL